MTSANLLTPILAFAPTDSTLRIGTILRPAEARCREDAVSKFYVLIAALAYIAFTLWTIVSPKRPKSRDE